MRGSGVKVDRTIARAHLDGVRLAVDHLELLVQADSNLQNKKSPLGIGGMSGLTKSELERLTGAYSFQNRTS